MKWESFDNKKRKKYLQSIQREECLEDNENERE